MRDLVGIFCLIGVLSGCGGYDIHGNTVVFKHCSENGCLTNVVEDADPKSFETLQGDYAKDRLHVYYGGGALPEADPQSFRVLSDSYSKDSARVYFERQPVPGADPVSFVALSDLNYGRDSKDIYILGSPVGVCDLASFKWLKDDWQVDNRCAYRHANKLPGARPESFVVLNDWYAKDGEHVFDSVTRKSIDGADAATFRLAEGPCSVCARDKNHCYKTGSQSACDFPK